MKRIHFFFISLQLHLRWDIINEQSVFKGDVLKSGKMGKFKDLVDFDRGQTGDG